ncbi:MAG: transcriptional regulator [Candidatus Korarchaeota archaeon]|nr:transcriptional regulator [Candidatus Korarchaeota archaeon]
MKDVFEIGYRYLMPFLRGSLVRKLIEKGLNEVEIASILVMTQSAISRYANLKRGGVVDLSHRPDVTNKIEKLAKEIVNGGLNPYEIQIELLRIALYSLARGYVCEFHNVIDPRINPKECGICKKLFKDFASEG